MGLLCCIQIIPLSVPRMSIVLPDTSIDVWLDCSIFLFRPKARRLPTSIEEHEVPVSIKALVGFSSILMFNSADTLFAMFIPEWPSHCWTLGQTDFHESWPLLPHAWQ